MSPTSPTSYHRANGDSVSLVFSPEGSVSTAFLHVDGKKLDVSGQLPGLCESNAEDYLSSFGWTPGQQTPIESAASTALSRVAPPLSVERVRKGDHHVVLECIRSADRESPLCIPAAIYIVTPLGVTLHWSTSTAAYSLDPTPFAALLKPD
jgi:hypothetical protein